MKHDYLEEVRAGLGSRLTETHFNLGQKYRGKVRDTYDLGDCIALITTDRQSAFDRLLAAVPYKGQALNLTSAWWFEKTAHMVPNHVLAIPDPNVTIAKKCTVFPIEFVVRGYITGTTSTSLWTHYHQGERYYCGHHLPEGLEKNQRLQSPLLTPTTKDEHDLPIAAADIVSQGFMSQSDWDTASAMALKLYEFGVGVAAEHGLILVDTKYEFGKDADGNIVLVDEIHTPDSSRYWLAASYEARMAQQMEPENIDKEFLRLWFVQHCDPYKDAILPEAPEDLVLTLGARYIQLYEMITNQSFVFSTRQEPTEVRILRHIMAYLDSIGQQQDH
jgi:phosphoribosylaminoimidazole-succinocarboxamide synthase